MPVSIINRCWSKVILEVLIRNGAEHICIAPSLRATALITESFHLQNGKRALCHVHYDEKSLGFFALGLAKSTQKPVIIIANSGIATANLYPAVIEAAQSATNLIILSVDNFLEPIEYTNNNAFLKQNMFANYPAVSINLPVANENYAADWLISTIEHLCYQQNIKNDIAYINIPFSTSSSEVASIEEQQVDSHVWLSSVQDWLFNHKSWVAHSQAQCEVLIHKNWDIWRAKKGIIIVGRLPLAQSMGINAWLTTMGWIALTDVQAGIQADLPYADIWLANQTVRDKLLQADIVIQLGSHLISERINQFLIDFKGEYWVVDDSQQQIDINYHAQTRFNVKVHHWLRAHPPLRQKPWLIEPFALSQFCGGFIEQQIGGNLNEISLAYYIERILPSTGTLFLGNGFFIKLINSLCKLPEGYPIFTNFGAKSIDGLLATAAGIGASAQQPVVAILDDLSVLHDLNSMALLKRVSQPTALFILNKGGTDLLDSLPIREDKKIERLDLPYEHEFSQIATMFDLKYTRPYTWADLSAVLKQTYARKETTLIEIKVNPNEGTNLYNNLVEQISQAVIDS